MTWVSTFSKVLKEILKDPKKRKAAKEGIRLIVAIFKILLKLMPIIIDWLNGKKIAIVGPTAAGKNSLYHRLKGEPVPKRHIQTRGTEKVKRFTLKMTLGDGKPFKLRCRRALNVGGEVDERERNWFVACNKADVIFYIASVEYFKKSTFSPRTRIYTDMKWMAQNLGKFGKNTLIHILVNKIDIEISRKRMSKKNHDKLKSQVEKFEKMSKNVFKAYSNRLTGVTPTSMKDDHIFAVSFPQALGAVYKAAKK
jgi:hypothetical protein